MALHAQPLKYVMRRSGGFTLVELMVAISLAAGLALYAAPAFDQWRMRERV
ncbi:prepilin-type N-terminal cleavage/methylation domain-containing protein, partial [Burkholderia sp. LMG 13014]